MNAHRFLPGLALLALTAADFGTAQNSALGPLVYLDNNRIHVTNLATGKTKFFIAISYAVGGASITETGVIAQYL